MTDSRADPAALLAEGRRRYEAGEYADAEPLARRALELLPPGSAPLERAVAVQLAGECAFSLGRYREARELADEAATLRDGAPDEAVAESRNLQGIVDVALGDHQRGYDRLADALRLREAALGPDAQDTLESLNNTGVALGRLGRADEAVATHEEALRRCERASAEPTRQLAVTCNALAVKLDGHDATQARADELYARSLAAAEAALGPEHPMVATLTANIGTARLNAGDRAAARPMLERALGLHFRAYGPSHPSTASALLSAAEIARLEGRLGEARGMTSAATAARLDAFGFRDPRTMRAVVMLMRLVGMQVATDPTVQADAAALAEVYRDLVPGPVAGDAVRFHPDPVRGEAALRALLARDAERVLGADAAVRAALDRAQAASLAADAALLRGQADVAVVAAAEAVSRIEDARAPLHLDLFRPLTRLAGFQRAAGQTREALETDARVIEVVVAAYGDRHPYALGSRGRLAVEATRIGDRTTAERELAALRQVVADADPDGAAARLLRNVEGAVERVAARRRAVTQA